MKLFGNLRFGFVVLVALLFAGALKLGGGHPMPPHRSSPERRQANMLMLRFQDALAAERWEEALSFCSQRVRDGAAASPSLKQFFTNTMPIEHVLAKDFGCWSCGEKFYGMFVTISDWDVTPRIDWYWGLAAKPGGWEVDYPPVKLDDYVKKKKAALQERETGTKQILQSLEPKARGIKTRVVPVSDRFILGSPMFFRVELINSGATAVHYQDSGVQYKPLTVLNERREPIQYFVAPAQIGMKQDELAAGSSTILAAKIDINSHHEITKPGKYFVQLDSSELAIGEPVPSWEPGRFGENDASPSSVFGLLAATNKFPSNVVEIEVRP